MLQWRFTAVLALIALAGFLGQLGSDPGNGWSWF
jgi:hypothetical protein